MKVLGFRVYYYYFDFLGCHFEFKMSNLGNLRTLSNVSMGLRAEGLGFKVFRETSPQIELLEKAAFP